MYVMYVLRELQQPLHARTVRGVLRTGSRRLATRVRHAQLPRQRHALLGHLRLRPRGVLSDRLLRPDRTTMIECLAFRANQGRLNHAYYDSPPALRCEPRDLVRAEWLQGSKRHRRW